VIAAVAALAAGCVTEQPYSLPQSMPSQGQSSSPYYGYGSSYYGYGPGSNYYNNGPGYGYYSDPQYYGSVARYPYGYYYPYPVIVRCPDTNRDGRCDKPVKHDDDGDHDGDGHHHRGDRDDNPKYRGLQQQTPVQVRPQQHQGQVLRVVPPPTKSARPPVVNPPRSRGDDVQERTFEPRRQSPQTRPVDPPRYRGQ